MISKIMGLVLFCESYDNVTRGVFLLVDLIEAVSQNPQYCYKSILNVLNVSCPDSSYQDPHLGPGLVFIFTDSHIKLKCQYGDGLTTI